MKPHTSKTNVPKAKPKAPVQPKSGKGKAATPAAPASGKARVAETPAPPPMNSRKVAKAPAVALKSLDMTLKKVDESEKGAAKATKRLPASSGSSTSVVSKKARSVAPMGVRKPKPADVAPEAAPPKKTAKPVKQPPAQITVKEEVAAVPAAPKAVEAKAEKAAAKPKPKPKPKPNTKPKRLLRGKGSAKKKDWQRFVIDCSCLAEDMLMDVADLEKYMKSHIKVNQRINNLADLVNFERSKHSSLTINSSVHFSKRYFKYLTKRYLKKNSLRDWVRVVSTDKETFTMRYFKIQGQDDDDDDDVINLKD